MAKPSLSARTSVASTRDGNGRGTAPSRKDDDGNQIHNEILLALPRTESDAVLPKLEFVRLKLQQLIHEAGETLKSVYFVNSGMFSILNVMPDGKSVEVGLIGKEGVSGTPVVAGFRTSHTRAVVQADATAFLRDRCSAGCWWNGGSIPGAGYAPGPHRRHPDSSGAFCR